MSLWRVKIKDKVSSSYEFFTTPKVENGIILDAKGMFVRMKHGDNLLFIKDLEYKNENKDSPYHTIDLLSIAFGGRAGLYNEVLQQWDEFNKIDGSVFLTPSGQLTWISEMNYEYIRRIKT